MSNAFVTIKMCYVYNQWYDISCAILCIVCKCVSWNSSVGIATRYGLDGPGIETQLGGDISSIPPD